MTKEREDLSLTQIEGETTIQDLIIKIRRSIIYILSKWPVVLAFIIVGGILGFSYSYYKKPIYTATTTFVLESGESSGSSLSQYAGVASMVGIDLGGGGGGIFQGDNIMELYRSRTMIEKTLLSQFNNKSNELIIERYIKFKNLKKKLGKEINWETVVFKVNGTNSKAGDVRLRDSIIRIVTADINKNILMVSRPDKKLSIIKVDVKTEDEAFAKIFNWELVRNVNDFYVQTKTKKSLLNVSILAQKVDSVRAVMNGAISGAASVNDATPNLNPTKLSQRIVPVERFRFSAETNKGILAELVKNLEMSKMSLMKETPLIQVIDEPILPLEREKVSKVFSTLQGAAIFAVIAIIYLIIKKLLT
jgi:hypothetical protein